MEIPQLRTVGVIATEVNAPIDRVLYALKTRGIKHIARAGTLRLYAPAAVDAVRAALLEMDRRHTNPKRREVPV